LIQVQQRRATRRKKLNAPLVEDVARIIVIVAALLCLFPVYWAAVTSLKNPVDIGAIPPKWFLRY
jgi:ABC-type glycerol-3-phosphate transport system permease component